MADNVFQLDDYRSFDPILREGDIVRIVNTRDTVDPWLQDEECITEFDGQTAIVTSICMTLPSSHETAAGQATYVDIAVAVGDDEWMTFNAISCVHVHRLLQASIEMRADRGMK
jgi:hypothetical protein